MNLSFLDEVKLDSNNTEKKVKFREDEIYLLKYIKFKDRKFSTFIKELIRRDLEDYEAKKVSKEEIEKIAIKVYRREKNK